MNQEFKIIAPLKNAFQKCKKSMKIFQNMVLSLIYKIYHQTRSILSPH